MSMSHGLSVHESISSDNYDYVISLRATYVPYVAQNMLLTVKYSQYDVCAKIMESKGSLMGS
eukprot:Seg1867.4 transcript_id=Seg1867.4/GoldUCD/mRNA.D3Y31 product="hypothetical protein" protein_id=Seg1867.4/GoldUCD/D3Y31